jgi:hypothetical protein
MKLLYLGAPNELSEDCKECVKPMSLPVAVQASKLSWPSQRAIRQESTKGSPFGVMYNAVINAEPSGTTPEPDSYVLLGLGLAGIGILNARARRALAVKPVMGRH